MKNRSKKQIKSKFKLNNPKKLRDIKTYGK